MGQRTTMKQKENALFRLLISVKVEYVWKAGMPWSYVLMQEGRIVLWQDERRVFKISSSINKTGGYNYTTKETRLAVSKMF